MGKLQSAIRSRDRTLKRRMLGAVETLIYDAQSYHSNVTSQWKNKPDWRVMFLHDETVIIGRLVSADSRSKIWRYVDEGTGTHGPRRRPYFIFPRYAPMLRFQTGYSARTQPIARFNVGTGKKFGPFVSKPFVLHPGIKPREFTKTYADKVRPQFRVMVIQTIAKTK